MGNHGVGPPRYGVIRVPIRENCVAGPHRSNILAAVRVVQEHTAVVAVSVNAVIVTGIVGVGDVDGRINDAETMLVLRSICLVLLCAYGM